MHIALRLGLIATVAVTGFTAWQDAQQQAADAQPGVAQRAPVAPTSRADEDARGAEIAAAFDQSAAKPVDLFSARLWLKEPEPPLKGPKGRDGKPTRLVPPPQAPALPLQFAGVWVEGPVRFVVLSAAGQQFLLCTQCSTQGSLQVGDTLLGQYRLESLDANQAVFTYLPLMQRQSLMLESM